MLTPAQEQEQRHHRIRDTAAKLFKDATEKRTYRVSIPREPGFPELDVPAATEHQAMGRYNVACAIHWTPYDHKVEDVTPKPAKPKAPPTPVVTEKK